MTCDICGATIQARRYSTGYATMLNGAIACYNCADIQQRADMRMQGYTFGYIGEDGKYVTTWSGGVLLRVTYVSQPKRVGFGRRQYVKAVDTFTGHHYSGSGPVDNGNYVRMRRTKVSS